MRIGLVLAATPPYSETFFRNKIRILKEHGFEVVLFVDQLKTPFDDCIVRKGYSGNNKSFFSLFKALMNLTIHLKQTFKLFKANRLDGFTIKQNVSSLITSAHILGHSLDWLHFGFATMAIHRENTAAAIGAKMAVSVRGSDLHVYPIMHPNCYTLTWKRIDRLHHISNYLLKLAIQQGFVLNESNAYLITPAINTSFFSASNTRVKNSRLVICTVARLHWIKGLEYVLESLAILKRNGIDFEYHLIGDGDDYNRLYFVAHQLDILQNIQFHGKQPQDVINLYLAKADLFIMYSLDEGFCNAVLEAQAMGCFTLVSNNAALMENVIDGKTGWVVEGRNSMALAEAITKFVDLPSSIKDSILASAISRVNNQFNLQLQKEAFIRFYEVN